MSQGTQHTSTNQTTRRWLRAGARALVVIVIYCLQLMGPLIIGAAIIISAALIKTLPGQVVLVLIASWIALNIFGIDVTNLKGLREGAEENPSIILDFILGFLS